MPSAAYESCSNMARNKSAGLVVPVLLLGGGAFVAQRIGLFDRLRVSLEAGGAGMGAAAQAMPLGGAPGSTQAQPTAGGGLMSPPTTSMVTTNTAPRIPGKTLADRLRAIGRGDLAAAVESRTRPGGPGTASVLDSRNDIQQAGTNTAARTLPNPNNLAALADEGIFFGAQGSTPRASFDGANQFTPDEASTRNHVIQAGDTLGALASRFGTTVGKLAALNNISNPNLIREGATLRVA